MACGPLLRTEQKKRGFCSIVFFGYLSNEPIGSRRCTMFESRWRHLTTFSDLPSAQVFADALSADGIGVRIISEGMFLGQAAPARIFIPSEQFHRGKRVLADSGVSDEELTRLSLGAPFEDEPQID
jgi:hypothetical protein